MIWFVKDLNYKRIAMNNNSTNIKGFRSAPYNRNTSSSSSSSSTSTRSYFNPSEIGDSDNESITDDKKIQIFDKRAPVHAKQMTVACATKNIKGHKLIRIAHKQVSNFYSELINLACEPEKDLGGCAMLPCPKTVKDTQIGGDFIIINDPEFWVMALGGSNTMMPRTEVEGYFLYNSPYPYSTMKSKQQFAGVTISNSAFLIIDKRLHIQDDFHIGKFNVTEHWCRDDKNDWCSIKKTDLSYTQIVKAIRHLQTDYSLSDTDLAKLQLFRLKNPGFDVLEFIKKAHELSKVGIDLIEYFRHNDKFCNIRNHINNIDGLYINTLETLKLFEEQNPTDQDTQDILKEIEWFQKIGSDLTILLMFSRTTPRTIYDLPKFLFRKDFSEELIKQIVQFVDYLNCLMFMVEASGLNAALVTGVMTLELVKEGELSYKQAFKDNDYGGAYPYANTDGKSAGTYSNREPIIKDKNLKSMKDYRGNPNYSPTAVKEAIIIKSWLHARNIIGKGTKAYEVQLAEITAEIKKLLVYYFNGGTLIQYVSIPKIKYKEILE
jgi:hypothetical protein